MRDAATQCHDLQYNPVFPDHRVQESDMLRSPQYFLVILALAAITAQPTYAQDKTKDPKFVIDLETPAPANDSKAKEPKFLHKAYRIKQV
jgi:hypothetical protein